MDEQVPARIPSGALLLSVPQMLDPNFMHTVVVMVEHNDQGALGLVINHRLDLRLEQLVEGHPVLHGRDFPVHSGGPVGDDNLQFLHRLPELVDGGLELEDGLFLGGRLEALAQTLDDGTATPDRLRFLMGYSGWGAGQLEAELQTGSWVLAPPDPALCFTPLGREAVWRRALESLGDAGRRLAQLPPDVTWN